APPEAGERPPSEQTGPAGEAARPAPGETARPGGRTGEGGAPPTDQSLEQWLERVPDDPAALLRERFRLEAQRRGVQAEGPPW
ncbi:MAG TPA: hypothetical protein VKA64_07415, partial [Gammaproteobacteria bacterium]|nr:hypothetical protein [Gammaproteobacteria bacterium]